jgi:flagellar biosynthetic protein FliR
MSLIVDPVWMTAAMLIALRIAPLFVMAPVLGGADIPVRIRVFLSLGFAVMIAAAAGSSVAPGTLPPLDAPGALIAAAVSELAIGIALVFGVFAAFAAFLFGGRLLDIQIGFGIANVFDPITRSQGPLLGTALNLLAIVVFFSIDGHHMLVRGFVDSLERFPPGRSLALLDPGAVVAQFGVVFSYGLLIVAPAVIALLLVDAGLAIAARTMPQMNIFIVAMPLKVVVGILTLALSMQYLGPAMSKIFGSIGTYWLRLLS